MHFTKDPGIEDRMTILGGRLGDYYWRRQNIIWIAPRELARMSGWAYLEKALVYNRGDAGRDP